MEDNILNLLAELCNDDDVRNNLDEDLFESGRLDSMTFVEMLYAIEENFGIIIPPSEFQRSDINTANKIINIVKARMN